MRLFACTLLMSRMVFAQGQKKPGKGPEMTMTGCLNKGTDGVSEHYSFTDHTVRLIGSETSNVFTATKVEHVAATCEAKGAK